MTGFEVKIHLDERLVEEIRRIGMLRYPSEACGVLLPTPRGRMIESQVVEMPNRSTNPDLEYVISPDDMLLSLQDWARSASRDEKDALAVWHTHPGGNIGPSRLDMARKLKNGTYLVVALTPEGAIPTWF